MTATPLTFQAAWIASLLSKTPITSLLGSPREVREAEWQGTDFSFPAIRVDLDYFPAVEGCGPDDAEVRLHVFSDEKSSRKVTQIASLIYETYHRKPFSAGIVRFSTVIVRSIERPDKSIYAWERIVKVFCQGI